MLTCHDITHNGSIRLDLTSDLRSNFELDLVRPTLVSFDSSRQEAHNGDQTIVLAQIGQKLVKSLCYKLVLDRAKLWPLVPKRLTLYQIWGHIPDRPFYCAYAAFCRLLSSWASERFSSGALHQICTSKILIRVTYSTNFVFLALTGTDIAEVSYLPPSPLQGA